jgi:ribonuclease P protein component
MQESTSDRTPPPQRGARLRRHADYQRVYQESRKHFSASMTYFFTLRVEPWPTVSGPRVGLTAGRVLGKAVERNRIKRRMREAVRKNLASLCSDVDVVLHPRKSVLQMDSSRLEGEVGCIFASVEASLKERVQGAGA